MSNLNQANDLLKELREYQSLVGTDKHLHVWEDSIIDLQDQKKKLELFKSDYEVLDKTLKDLPNKLKHNIMVPFSDVAFFPGYITHTNEVTVLLGDNYFTKTTTGHARDILKHINDNLKTVEKNLEQLTVRTQLQRDLNVHNKMMEEDNIVEIKEEYHSDEEKEVKIKPPRQIDDKEEEARANYLARLMELEQEEERAMATGEYVDEDDDYEEEYYEDEEDEDEDEEEEYYEEEDERPPVVEIPKSIKSPSDIYDNFYKSTTTTTTPANKVAEKVVEKEAEPDKKKEKKHVHFEIPEAEAPKPIPLKSVNTAFSGMIVERDAVVKDVIGAVQEKEEVPQEEEKPKRVSLFKAQRNKP